MSLAEDVQEDLQRRANAVGSDEAELVSRLERDVKQLCTLQAMHHAVECAQGTLQRTAQQLKETQRNVTSMVRR